MTTSQRLTLCVVLALGACCLTVSAKTDQQSQSHALVAKADESRALTTVKFEPFTIFSKVYCTPRTTPTLRTLHP